jgi:hypothetical protein
VIYYDNVDARFPCTGQKPCPRSRFEITGFAKNEGPGRTLKVQGAAGGRGFQNDNFTEN